MYTESSPAEKLTERILELSADAQIERRTFAKDSPAFHNLSGAVVAYGKVLALLAALQRLQQLHVSVGQFEAPNSAATRMH